MADRNTIRSTRRHRPASSSGWLAVSILALSLGLPAAQADDLYATLEGNDSFQILTALLRSTDTLDRLEADAFTVFAPSDQAFRTLPAGTLAELLEDREALTTLLQHHIIAGQSYEADNLPEQLSPMAGGTINVGIADSGAVLRPAGQDHVRLPFEMANIRADNGIIHGINQVLMPETVGVRLAAMQQNISVQEALERVEERDYSWEKLDADQDGYISYTEAETYQLMGGL
ncbi:MAG: fasciclin domain-containing protein, partial [Candidatus Competibacteraceae bacterium]|nr:fasciclin domain-containing protein [Candidatus Competibacteraceae bacterium]